MMLGYHDWRDVRNDVILLYVLSKVALIGYVFYDWFFFPSHGSRVLGMLWKYFTPESAIYQWVSRIYMWHLR